MIPQGVIDEKVKHWGQLITAQRVHAIASHVHHLTRKGRVHNETGLFVSLVNEAVADHIAAWERSQSPFERDRHALFMVEMLRTARRSDPTDVAEYIRAARVNGFPQLDEYLVQKLEALGHTWDRSD